MDSFLSEDIAPTIFHFVGLYLVLLTSAQGLMHVYRHRLSTGHSLVELKPRAGDSLVQQVFANQIFLLVLMALYVFVVKPDPARFGFTELGVWWPAALMAGMVAYFGYLVVINTAFKALGVHDTLVADSYVAFRTLWPRSATRQRQLQLSLLINPFTEELLYRGFLVYFLGTVSGHHAVFVMFGLFVCLAVHAYQGVRILWFHASFYVFIVALLYSPLGMVGVFGAHLAGDIYPLLKAREQLAVYRRVRRSVRPINPAK